MLIGSVQFTIKNKNKIVFERITASSNEYVYLCHKDFNNMEKIDKLLNIIVEKESCPSVFFHLVISKKEIKSDYKSKKIDKTVYKKWKKAKRKFRKFIECSIIEKTEQEANEKKIKKLINKGALRKCFLVQKEFNSLEEKKNIKMTYQY